MLIFAHRGASADAPENTLAAFEEALAQQADGIELDVFQHGDELVVIHDRWLERTTNGTGSIYEHSFEQLQAFDAGNGQSIPTLKQALALINGRCQLNIEVKGIENIDCLLSHLALACSRHNFCQDQLLISSFNHHVLRQLSLTETDLRIGALTANKALTYAAFAVDLNAYSVHVDVTCIDKAFIDDAHARGMKIFAFTVDQASDARQLREWRLDGLFSNRPAYIKAMLNIQS